MGFPFVTHRCRSTARTAATNAYPAWRCQANLLWMVAQKSAKSAGPAQ
jgi:hypothetical protein